MNLGSYFEIKEPIAHFLLDGDGETIWFRDNDGEIVCFDNIPSNYPRWVICIQTLKENEWTAIVIFLIDLSRDQFFTDAHLVHIK